MGLNKKYLCLEKFFFSNKITFIPSAARPPKWPSPVFETALGNWDDGRKRNFWGHDDDYDKK